MQTLQHFNTLLVIFSEIAQEAKNCQRFPPLDIKFGRGPLLPDSGCFLFKLPPPSCNQCMHYYKILDTKSRLPDKGDHFGSGLALINSPKCTICSNAESIARFYLDFLYFPASIYHRFTLLKPWHWKSKYRFPSLVTYCLQGRFYNPTCWSVICDHIFCITQ